MKKHLNVKIHHFCDYVESEEIYMHDNAMQDQPARFLTKVLNKDTVTRRRRKILDVPNTKQDAKATK